MHGVELIKANRMLRRAAGQLDLLAIWFSFLKFVQLGLRMLYVRQTNKLSEKQLNLRVSLCRCPEVFL